MACAFYFILAAPHNMWDLNSPARDQTCVTCIGSSRVPTTGLLRKSPSGFLYLVHTKMERDPKLFLPIPLCWMHTHFLTFILFNRILVSLIISLLTACIPISSIWVVDQEWPGLLGIISYFWDSTSQLLLGSIRSRRELTTLELHTLSYLTHLLYHKIILKFLNHCRHYNRHTADHCSELSKEKSPES